MRLGKSLIIIVLACSFGVARGQADNSLLDKIDFNEIARCLTKAQESDTNPKNQQYNMILAADSILSKSVDSYQIYVALYQYLIGGFSELGANMVVDYLVRMPYLEYVNADTEQRNNIISIAESYSRVKIGSQAPEIHSVTVFDKEFDLYAINKKHVILLFWSYSCPHCRDLIDEMGKITTENDDVAIVTVNVSGDFKKVRKLIKKSGLKDQYNICDGKGWDSQIVDDYAVDMTPSLILLDKDKIIIAKPFDIEEVIKYLEL